MADQIDSFLASGGSTPLVAPGSVPAQSSGSDPVDSWLASGGQTNFAPAQSPPVSGDESVKRLVAHEATQMGAGILGGFRSIYDLATGKSIAETDQRYKDFVKEHSYQPSDPNSQALVGHYDKASASNANPLNWPGKAFDVVGENTFGPGSNLEEAVNREAAKRKGIPTMGVTNPDLAPMFSGALQFGVGAAQAVGGLRRAPVTIDQDAEPHPLAGAAEAETKRLADIKTRAQSSGFDLPEGGTAERHAAASATNTPLVNAAARTELDLPKDAPLTPNMLAKGRTAFGSPGYRAVENLEEAIPLDRDALEQAKTENMNATPNERLPFPEGDTITGAKAVDFSKKARFLANQLEKNPANPFAAQDAQMYRDAAEAVENSVRDHLETTGRGQMANDWDDSRRYVAKSYSVENALDGAGNVRAADLKNQLFKKGKPLSGGLEDVANLAAQYPEAFRTSRVTAPAPGIVRRATAAVVPHVTTAAGAGAGSILGPFGATAGAVSGRVLGEKLAGKINPP